MVGMVDPGHSSPLSAQCMMTSIDGSDCRIMAAIASKSGE
jgi:hypothetical protein